MIVPGSSNALLLAQAGDPLDELGKIERALRCRRTAGAYLSRTPSVTGSRTTWTYSFWLKTGVPLLDGSVYGLAVNHGDGSAYRDFLVLQGSQLKFGVNTYASTFTGGIITTAAPYRDPASHIHIHAVFDSTNATDAERLRLYVGGVRITSFSSPAATTPLNAQSWTNAAGIIHRIAVDLFAGSAQHLDGLLSHFAFVDGQALLPSAFGAFHPRTGQWRPRTKAVIRASVAGGGGARNGWGVNGYLLPFDDPTSPTTLGYDRSQSDTDTMGNNWTANNISLTTGSSYDSMLDTPTNNFAVLNSLAKPAGFYLSNGNLSCGSSIVPQNETLCATIGASSGKWYCEIKANYVSAASMIGVCPVTAGPQQNLSSNGVAYLQLDGAKGVFGTQSAYGPPCVAGDIVGIALDMDAGAVTFYRNGSNLGVAANGLSGSYTFAVCDAGASSGHYVDYDVNFGQRPFAYAPPAGFKSLCTKNLPSPRIPNPKAAFADVTDSGANIVAALAAASPWPSWIRIYKRRDAAEGWRWQFSDDPSNCLDSSAGAGKFAFPALAGASYSGQAFNASASNGIATGRLSHASGVADVVADGLANSRKMVILKGETSGAWYVYHPDLTAGKLLYLNSMATETADATISTVTAGGFTVAAALATDVYRWIAFAETAGFLKLGAYTGNASVDGPFGNLGGSPLFFLQKNAGNAETSWRLFDSVRSPRNPAQALLFPTYNYAEDSLTANATDLVSNGIKLRTTDTALNQAVKNVFMSVVAPFRYANAQ